MSYMHIDNLYANQDILLFKECYAMEKIHGTSAHISYNQGQLSFFSGGSKYAEFIKLFDTEILLAKLEEKFSKDQKVTIYGEAYGGKMQGMKDTYGPDIRFIAFEVNIDDMWLEVPKAEGIVQTLGLEFVHYDIMPTNLEALDNEMMKPSVQAFRNGMGSDKMREGIVLRPLLEVQKNNGGRIITKHKRPEFRETQTVRKIGQTFERKLEIQAITDEWVTHMRLMHVLDTFPDAKIQDTGEIIKAMIEDILRESNGEVKDTKELRGSISRETALMFKRYLNGKIKETL